MLILSNEMYLIIGYLITAIISILLAKGLKLPWLPKKPIRYSFEVSALFPTPVIAVGILAIFYRLGYTHIYHGLILAIIIGILSAIFTKYLFYTVFPEPPKGGE